MNVDSARSLHSRRLRWVLASTVVLFLGIFGRLVQLQVVQAGGLSALAQRQWRRELEIPARRGTIYDRDGEPLALSVEAYDIYATPYQVSDVASTAATLAGALGDTPAAWRARLTKGGGFSWLARRVEMARARAIKERRLPGIGFILSSRRTYRIGPVAGQVVGLVNIDGVGLEGLERFHDRVLAGRPGLLEAERDPMGRTLPGGLIRSSEPRDGQSIQVSLDSDIQYKAQVELNAAVKQWGAKGGVVIVMDPRTGEVLADVSAPGADPNKLTPKTIGGLRNRAITDVFEPGSTMKIVTVAAALEEKRVEPSTRFVLPPTITIGGHEVHEAHDRPTVDYSVSDILAHSSNIGAVKLALKLGKQTLFDYIGRFGITRRTGIDLPAETSGWVPRPADWSATSIGTIPFGQGISATPLQMACVTAIVANDGVAVTPHFLMARVGTSTPAVRGVRVLRVQTARAVRSMMARAVTEGTGDLARVPGYSVGGKTGTAQKAREGGRGYAEGAYLASFVGFGPAKTPRLVCVVAIDEPSDAIYGGVVAAPVFSKVMRFALSHLRVPPDRPQDIKASAGAGGAPARPTTTTPMAGDQ